jgi:hypothetical protein
MPLPLDLNSFKSIEQFATAVYLTTHRVEENGQYWADKEIRPMNPIAENTPFAHDFWAWSKTLVPLVAL